MILQPYQFISYLQTFNCVSNFEKVLSSEVMSDRACFVYQLDAARSRINETAYQVKEKVAQYGDDARKFVQSKTDTGVAA